jgi:hypothetical protein
MDAEPEQPKILIDEPDSIVVDAEGKTSVVGMYHSNMSTEEAREALAALYGTDPEKIRLGRDRTGPVGFRRWNSSWDPHAERSDPNLN